MNTGQMMMATGAVVLIGITVLTVNKMYNNHGEILRQTEIGVYAISFATSIIEEASGQNFDEVTVNDAITATTSLSTTLGAESGETTTPASTVNFDDFDDYNNLSMGTKVAGVDSFITKGKVVYVTDTSPDVATSSRTWHKKLTISVTNTAMRDTIKMNYVFSYFNFR